MEKVLEVENRKPWLVAQEEIEKTAKFVKARVETQGRGDPKHWASVSSPNPPHDISSKRLWGGGPYILICQSYI